ncbi:MAG: Stp1/IreP family PP2C-type Ser/Thr phosphatase [Bacilli bacterium]|jgi:serine/threonine protein phosphatase PrpC
METFYITDPGKVRDHNEDSVIIVKNKKHEYLMVVSDGMGGHSSGEVASSLAITHLAKDFTSLETIGSKTEAVNWLRRHANEINYKILEYATEHANGKGMGATLVVAILTKDYLLFGNIGDSSGFVLKDEKLHKITKDHTLVGLLVLTGELTNEQAKEHPRKNVLMKALGTNASIEMDIFDVDPNVDAILLCSDGLTNMVTTEQIERVLNSDLDIEEKVIKLVKKSNNRGGTDNISIAYLIKKSGDKYGNKGSKN